MRTRYPGLCPIPLPLPDFSRYKTARSGYILQPLQPPRRGANDTDPEDIDMRINNLGAAVASPTRVAAAVVALALCVIPLALASCGGGGAKLG